MIHAETCTAFICLLISLFGTTPSPENLTGVAIDRGIQLGSCDVCVQYILLFFTACDVHPYCRRLGKEGNEVTYLFQMIGTWQFIDFLFHWHFNSGL